MSQNNYSQFFLLFSKLQQIGYTQERDEIIYCHTSGRTTSLKELTDVEYKDMITWMSHILTRETAVNAEKETRQRRKVIALFCQMGYVKQERADMYRINQWCINYGHLKKSLNYYKGVDLVKLVNQAEKVYESFVKKL